MQVDPANATAIQLGRIRRLYDVWGSHPYDEDLSQGEHAVQCANLARNAGADDSLIVACLLHDVGHLLELERVSGSPNHSIDDEHEARGAAYLARAFDPAVTGPVALHVAAKRYLCTVEPAYHHSLSPASERSLTLQGGPMTSAEVARFESNPAAVRAVELRRWDDSAKNRSPSGLSFDDFAEELSRVLRSDGPA